MSLFGRNVELIWKGEKVKLEMTMEKVDEFEFGPDSPNVLEVAITIGNGAPKMTIVSKAYHKLLIMAGVKCKRDEVYGKMMAELSSGSREMLDACSVAISLMIPNLETGERQEFTKKK